MAKDFFGRDHKGRRDDDPQIRVTDRRRIQLDDDENADRTTVVESPSLKLSYVEELEARTRAAEQKTQEVQSRFEQLRKQLQRETDETRQRLNRAADERAQQGGNEICLLKLGSTISNAQPKPPKQVARLKILPKAYGERLRVSRTRLPLRGLSQSMLLVRHSIRSCTKRSRP